MRRGVVLDNDDPERLGRCKVFVPGVYPSELASTPSLLPWAEPAMSVFGGGWSSPKGSLNGESGVCSVPHAGRNGDGAQVWVFFNDGDVRYPVYFAVCQSGPGWFSRHPNQHVMQTDNVRVVVDEYEGYRTGTAGEGEISDDLSSEVSELSPSVFKAAVQRAGGVAGLKGCYDGMGGPGAFFSFMSECGGPGGLQQVSMQCMEGFSSLSEFLSGCGGSAGFASLVESSGGEVSFFAYTTEAKAAIAAQFGSVDEFNDLLNLVGGLEGLHAVCDRFGSVGMFVSAVTGIADVAGLDSLARLEAALGGAESLASFNASFIDGAGSLYRLFDGKDAEDRLQQLQAGELGKSNVAMTDTCTSDAGDGDPFISMATRKSVKTRVKVEVQVPDGDVGVDLHVKGDVNLKVDGNLYREVTGNVYETYLGDHHVYHRGGYSEFNDGSSYREVNGTVHDVIRGKSVQMLMGGVDQTILKNARTDVTDAVWSLSASRVSLDVESLFTVGCRNLSLTADAGFDVIGHGDSSLRVDGLFGVMASSCDHQVSTSHRINAASLTLTGTSVAELSSTTMVSISSPSPPDPEAEPLPPPNVSIMASTLVINSAVSAIFSHTASVIRRIYGALVDTIVGTRTSNVSGADTNVVGGIITNTAGAGIVNTATAGAIANNAVAGAVTNTAGAAITNTAGAGIVNTAGLAIADVAGTVITVKCGNEALVTLNGKKGSDTSSGTGGQFLLAN